VSLQFDFLFGGILADWCGVSEGFQHRNGWEPHPHSAVSLAPTINRTCNLTVRLSAYRNVRGVPLSPAMTVVDRKTVESIFTSSLRRLQSALGKKGT
jgi:hypothetical protein